MRGSTLSIESSSISLMFGIKLASFTSSSEKKQCPKTIFGAMVIAIAAGTELVLFLSCD